MPDNQRRPVAMPVIRHLVFLFLYAGLGAAAILLLPLWQPGLSGAPALALGAALFVLAGLLHESIGRLRAAAELGRTVSTLARSQRELEEELTWTRREVKAVREALEALAASAGGAAGTRGEGPKQAEQIMQEVRLLKAQIDRLSGPAAAKSEPPGASARALQLRLSAEDRPALSGVGARAARVSGLARVVEAARQPVARPGPDGLLEEVREALRDDRIDLVLQPIVSLPQRKHRAYECFSRLKTDAGEQLLPEQYIALAEGAGLISAIDNMLLFRCIQLVRKIQQHNHSTRFFCNLSSHTINDVDFFGELVGFLESNDELAPRLVFEFTQADFGSHGASERRALEQLANLGCHFSVDQVGDLSLDVRELAQRSVRYVKIQGSELLAWHLSEDEEERLSLLALKTSLDRHRVELIVEKVEEESTLVELLDYRIGYGQGYLFGEPKPAKDAA